jgi:lipopolysaccharide export system protein LptA
MPFSPFSSKIRASVNFTGFSRGLRLATLALAALGTGLAFAEKADRNKPMNIEADALKYDDLKQVSVFTGKVILTKGTIQIRGGQLDVRQDPEGYQFGLVLAEPGKLAFFRQKRDGVDEYIEGEGEVIEYDGKADTVKFVKRAQMRRFRGAVLSDEISGGVIVYDNTVDVFTVDGGTNRAATGTPGATGGRVRAMLTPKADPATAPAPTTAPITSSPPALKTSPALSPEKK